MSRAEELAARYKALLDAADRRERLSEQRQVERQARLKEERDTVMAELEEFAREIGHIDAERDEQGLALTWRGKTMRFRPRGEADVVEVITDGRGDVSLRYDDVQGYMLRVSHGTDVTRVPLFDRGLLALLVEGLGLPPLPEAPGGSKKAWAILLDDNSPEVITESGARRITPDE